jgi:hypothetical protein
MAKIKAKNKNKNCRNPLGTRVQSCQLLAYMTLPIPWFHALAVCMVHGKKGMLITVARYGQGKEGQEGQGQRQRKWR